MPLEREFGSLMILHRPNAGYNALRINDMRLKLAFVTLIISVSGQSLAQDPYAAYRQLQQAQALQAQQEQARAQQRQAYLQQQQLELQRLQLEQQVEAQRQQALQQQQIFELQQQQLLEQRKQIAAQQEVLDEQARAGAKRAPHPGWIEEKPR